MTTETMMIGDITLSLTNPDKMLWPEVGITKRKYLHQLMLLSPYLISHCEQHFLTTIRYPHGVHGDFFYQKNCPSTKPAFVTTANWHDHQYIVLKDLATLLWLGNLACLEFHISFQPIHDAKPSVWIMDLDPTHPDGPNIFEAASYIEEVLSKLNIESIAKTSGATGIQIMIPIEPEYTFDQLRKLGEFLAHYFVEKHPDLFTIERLIKNRGKKIYVDYLQYWSGKSIAAPYTPRANRFAAVSTPLTWEEVKRIPNIHDYHLLSLPQRLLTTGDLLQNLPKQSLKDILMFIEQN
ncbi:non-homologous end-joining DNA ligase [Longirhabdus pacifica]|uniref:non-homologous end-joining DNA ligase n=1 Tax=Longirhabdus pacifica TaxID=2305227 RepID=UPI00197E9C4C|nr:non-homologous end-joining DNA ligase [Longirhabdus pacifica]